MITGSGKTHTMLGANSHQRKIPSSTSSENLPSTAMATSQSDGLMVKAIDEVFRHVESSDNPEQFKVIIKAIEFSVD